VNTPRSVLQALDRLNGSPDFRVFVQWLEGEANEATEQLLVAPTEIKVFQCQGRAQALKDIVRTVTSARAALDRHV
jgi:hypothetical protein